MTLRVTAWALCLLSLHWATDRADAFAGSYVSEDGQVNLLLVEDLDGDFEGICVIGERTFLVEGELEEGRLVADCFTADPDGDEERYLVAAPADSVLLIHIMPLDVDDEPDWSLAEAWSLLPGADTTLPSSTETLAPADSGPVSMAGDPAGDPTMGGDPRLLGRWVSSQSMSSGDLALASRATFVVAPDGTFAVGGAEVVGGGSLGAFQSSPGDEVITGQWMADGQVFYIRNAGSPGWIPFARYHVEGGSLLLYFFDGTHQLWKRS